MALCQCYANGLKYSGILSSLNITQHSVTKQWSFSCFLALMTQIQLLFSKHPVVAHLPINRWWELAVIGSGDGQIWLAKKSSREVVFFFFFFHFYPALNQDTPDVSPWGVELALTSVIAKFHFGELIGRKHWPRYGVWWLSDRKKEKREDGKRIHGGFHFQLVWVLLWRAKILSIIGPDCDSVFSLSDYFSSHSLFLLLYLFFCC